MCCRTQLAPIAQTLQVGETSRISRGSPELVLKSERNWPMSRKSVRCRKPGAPAVVDSEEDVDVGCSGAALLLPPQPAAKRASAITNTASRLIGARVRSR